MINNKLVIKNGLIQRLCCLFLDIRTITIDPTVRTLDYRRWKFYVISQAASLAFSDWI